MAWTNPCLVVEREDGVLVDVVGGDDGERLEPRHLELLGYGHEGLARHLGIEYHVQISAH